MDFLKNTVHRIAPLGWQFQCLSASLLSTIWGDFYQELILAEVQIPVNACARQVTAQTDAVYSEVSHIVLNCTMFCLVLPGKYSLHRIAASISTGGEMPSAWKQQLQFKLQSSITTCDLSALLIATIFCLDSCACNTAQAQFNRCIFTRHASEF